MRSLSRAACFSEEVVHFHQQSSGQESRRMRLCLAGGYPDHPTLNVQIPQSSSRFGKVQG